MPNYLKCLVTKRGLRLFYVQLQYNYWIVINLKCLVTKRGLRQYNLPRKKLRLTGSEMPRY